MTEGHQQAAEQVGQQLAVGGGEPVQQLPLGLQVVGQRGVQGGLPAAVSVTTTARPSSRLRSRVIRPFSSSRSSRWVIAPEVTSAVRISAVGVSW